ncbi:MAG: outer membrane protein TolC [Saprospiraceae bacterium]|jgi:outer membrane protein TolC
MYKYGLCYKALICTFFTLWGISVNAQEISSESSLPIATINDCYEWSRANFPLIKQMDIIDKATQFSLANASSGNLPQINLNSQASYQSAVTSFPIDIPNVEVSNVSKDQYKIYGEVYQPLTSFSKVNIKKKQVEINGELEKQKVEVNLYQLKERINQTYFGVLLINERIEQLDIIISDLDSALVKVGAAIDNGTATLTDKRLLRVERISMVQKIEENESNQLAFLNILSLLTGKKIPKSTILDKPVVQPELSMTSRPELRVFKLQNDAIDIQSEQLNNSLRPTLGIFAQGGYGRPALNFLSNDFELYYLGGLKLKWNISSFYNHKNSKNSLQTLKDKVMTQRETFLLNTEVSQSQQTAEITKYKGLMKSDNDIVNIRIEILNTAKVQLDNGLITTIDYVKYLNDVNLAKQTLLLYETQLLLAIYN